MFFVSIFRTLVASTPRQPHKLCIFVLRKRDGVWTITKKPPRERCSQFSSSQQVSAKKMVPRPPEDLSESSHFQSSKISHSKNNKKDYTQHSTVGFLSFFVNSQEVFLRIVCFLSFCSSTVWATFPPGGFLRKELLFQLSAETTSSAFQEPVLVGRPKPNKSCLVRFKITYFDI